MQNLIMISIFQTYAELCVGKVIFGIEEPEIYLYPTAQRALYKSMQELSVETQIIYTTHSQNFVDAYRFPEVQLVDKNDGLGTFVSKKSSYVNWTNAEKNRFKIYAHFDSDRNDIFFAKKYILVEGDSDKVFWSTIIVEKFGINIHKEGVSIIECGGKQGVLYFLGLSQLIGKLNCFAIWDRDTKEAIDDQRSVFQTVLNLNRGMEVIAKKLNIC
jgi:putative ATP-dependent endonuclease of the OLD family